MKKAALGKAIYSHRTYAESLGGLYPTESQFRNGMAGMNFTCHAGSIAEVRTRE